MGGPVYKLLFLHAAYNYNRARFFMLRKWLGDRAKFGAGADVWADCFRMKGQGVVEIGPGCAVERGPFPFAVELERGSLLKIGQNTWVRGKYRPNVITCFEDARVEIGEDSLLNGTIISSRRNITIGRSAALSWNTTIIDSDLHQMDSDSPIRSAAVTIGDFVMIGTGATVLPGVNIGAHSVIGAGSVVREDVPSHVVAAGNPARVLREIGARTDCL